MANRRRGLHALIGSSVAIFWPGAFIFGFPGVMAPYWSQSFGVGRGAIGAIMFFVSSRSWTSDVSSLVDCKTDLVLKRWSQ